MTVQDLMNKLKKLPKDSLVVVSGYEQGYNTVNSVEKIKVCLDINTTKWYYGAHDTVDIYNAYSENETIIPETEVYYISSKPL
jgi:hypothetical protein